MAKLSPQNDKHESYMFHCPGCKQAHVIWAKPRGKSSGWKFNGDIEKPTFHPSLLVRYKYKDKKIVCHSFIKDGMIQFINDSTHHLKGQTVEIPDWDKNK